MWEGSRARTKWPSIALLAVCQVMALTLWFSATAVIPALRSELALDDTQTSLFTSAVAVGFHRRKRTFGQSERRDRL